MAATTSAAGPQTETIRNHAAFIWSVADLLRGDYKQSEYGKVILPLTVLRRLDCVLEPTKADGARRARRSSTGRVENLEPGPAAGVAGEQFYNTSPLDLPKLLDDPDNIADNLRAYIAGFSPARARRAREVRLRHPDRPARPREPALPGRLASSPRSTCTPRPSRTSRWATSTRS